MFLLYNILNTSSDGTLNVVINRDENDFEKDNISCLIAASKMLVFYMKDHPTLDQSTRTMIR